MEIRPCEQCGGDIPWNKADYPARYAKKRFCSKTCVNLGRNPMYNISLPNHGSKLIVDLFCGAGGSSMGYYTAGFDVLGVDIKRQDSYPFGFIKADVFDIWDSLPHDNIVAYAASPPCQLYSVMTRGRWAMRDHLDLISKTRELLAGTGKPYIIENVPGAAGELQNPFTLCGTSFGLQTASGNQLRRHRVFETNWPVADPPPCNHNDMRAIGVYGGGQNPERTNGEPMRFEERQEAMGINWMSWLNLNQAVPPAYTEWIGEQLNELQTLSIG